MNFLEICNRVFMEGDRTWYDITDTTVSADNDEQVNKIILWVKQAYLDLQRLSPFLTFLHTSGTLFSTSADGTKDYSATGVRYLLRDSLYARITATPTDAWDLTYLTYQDWRDLFVRIGDQLADSRPIWFTELPNGQYRLEPGPSVACDICADWYRVPFVFEQDEDEPAWDEDLHDIIVWHVLERYVNEYETPNELKERVSLEKRRTRQEFLFRYLPEMQINTGQWP